MMIQILQGDCLEVMPTLAADSVHSVVTDPPYGLAFMGKAWDHGVPGSDYWRAVLRVAKPGAHLLATAIEDAGWEIRDCIMWVYGSGFPKSLDVSKAIGNSDAAKWQGWGTALKPAWEPIIVARRPLAGTVANNVLANGTGGINVGACRVGYDERVASFTSLAPCKGNRLGEAGTQEARRGTQGDPKTYIGRWPANVIHDGSDEVLNQFPHVASGEPAGIKAGGKLNCYSEFAGGIPVSGYGDEGSAARFFYCAKASASDREPWNNHPTVKPTALMRYLVRMVTPAGGIVLDPFYGSGTTGVAAQLEACSAIGIELNPEYVALAKRRVQQRSLY